MNRYKTKYFKEIEGISEFLKNGYNIENCVVQDIDFRGLQINWKSVKLKGCCFLGCTFSADSLPYIYQEATVFPHPHNIPYQPYRKNLYSWQELAKGHEKCSVDLDIYNHFSKYRHHHDVVEMLYQRLHDHAIDDALYDLLNHHGDKKVVGIMGGHGTKRTDPNYAKAALTAQALAADGYYVASGGGPGIMEASNFGAYMANYTPQDLLTALEMMTDAPHYTDADYHDLAVSVLDRYTNGNSNLAIPTWFYGHEPSNVFASSIAKYFSNSIREDTLLAISLHGVVYAPGSAGTTQEIFMDAAQNHYGTFGDVSPMVFLGTERYTKETNLYQTLYDLAEGKAYQKSMHLTDEPLDVLSFIKAHPPIPYK